VKTVRHAPCRHCGQEPATRSRGLGWKCYFTPGVREMYPSTSAYANRGHGRDTAGRLPTKPTSARPGTPEKMAVMRARAAAGEVLFHPLDGRV
jgi:hypothetical protein